MICSMHAFFGREKDLLKEEVENSCNVRVSLEISEEESILPEIVI